MRLSKGEKRVLRALHDFGFDALSRDCNTTLAALEREGLVRVAWSEGRIAEYAALTDTAKELFLNNPRLHNDVNWSMIAALASGISVIIAIVAMFIACSR